MCGGPPVFFPHISTSNLLNISAEWNRPQQRGRSSVIEGVYNNVHFMHAIASQIGNVVQVQTRSGAVFEGVFNTVSPQFDIVLQLAHQIKGKPFFLVFRRF